MQIKSIELTNFKKHGYLNIDFEAGSNMLVGANYAGKSTVVQAILVGLYGNSCAPGQTSHLIKTGSNDFKIVLKLSNGLTVTRSSRDSSVRRGEDEPFARSHTAVNAAMAEALGLDKNAFLKVYSSEQGSPQQLLQMEGAELQRFIESCIGIEALDATVKNANKEAMLQLSSSKSMDEWVMEPEIYTEQINLLKDIDNQLAELEITKASTELSIQESQQQQAELSTKLEALVQHNADVTIYTAQEGQLAKLELKAPTDTKALERKINELQEIHNQQATVQRLKRDLARLVKQQQDIKDSRTELDVVWIDLEPLDSVIEKEKEIFRLQEKEANRIGNILKNGVCHSCNRPFTVTLNHEVLQSQLLKAQEGLEESKRDMAKYLSKLKELREQNAMVERHEREKAAKVVDIERCQADIDRIMRELATLTEADVKDEITSLNSELRKFDRENDRIEADNTQFHKLTRALAGLKKPEGGTVDVAPVRADLTSLKQEIDSHRLCLTQAQQKCIELTGKQARLNSAIELHTRAEEKVGNYMKQAKLYKSVATILSDSRTQIISEALTIIFSVASEFALVCTQGDMQEILLHGGSISYRENGVIYNKHSASGAQKTLIGIGMKLGLVRLVTSDFDCLLLDEVSADMSNEVSMRCMLALDNFCNQVVSVSHRTNDVAGNVIDL
jgi:exonuclease SbcC